MSETSNASAGSSLQETIVTLPRPLVIALAFLLVGASIGSAWLAAIGVRRASTRLVDQPVLAESPLLGASGQEA